ncbi:alkaline phosphatase family protein [Thermodesulfobacteriota bacterium]
MRSSAEAPINTCQSQESAMSLNRVAVLGLDGVPFSLLNDLFDAGLMPNLARMARSGSFLRMETTLPPVSSVAWTSFMTGVNPGEHGIFGFTDLNPGEISLKLPSADDIRAPTLWQQMPDKFSVIINLPFTYPARPLNGVMICGFVAPIFERSVYPQSLASRLRSLQYRIDVDAVKGRHDRHGLIRDLFETLNLREQVIWSLMKEQPWELLTAVVTGTDRLHHFFFDAADTPGHPFHRDFTDYYRRVDSLFGRFRELAGSSTRLVVLSDHGFAGLKTQVYLNHILKTMGYVSFERPEPQSIDDISASSLAFAMEPGRIYLNGRDRFRSGRLARDEERGVRANLKAELARLSLADIGLTDGDFHDPPNAALFEKILTKEEAYHGQCLDLAPDLILVPRRGFDLKADVGARTHAMKDIFTGMHTHDDAFLMVDDPEIAQRLPEPKITDVAALITEVLV